MKVITREDIFLMHKSVLVPIGLSLLLFTGCLRTYYPAIWGTRAPALITEKENPNGSASKYFGFDYSNALPYYDHESNQ